MPPVHAAILSMLSIGLPACRPCGPQQRTCRVGQSHQGRRQPPWTTWTKWTTWTRGCYVPPGPCSPYRPCCPLGYPHVVRVVHSSGVPNTHRGRGWCNPATVCRAHRTIDAVRAWRWCSPERTTHAHRILQTLPDLRALPHLQDHVFGKVYTRSLWVGDNHPSPLAQYGI